MSLRVLVCYGMMYYVMSFRVIAISCHVMLHLMFVRTKDVVPMSETIWPYSAFYVDKVFVKLSNCASSFLKNPQLMV